MSPPTSYAWKVKFADWTMSPSANVNAGSVLHGWEERR